MLEELTAGSLIALEVTRHAPSSAVPLTTAKTSSSVVASFREFVGPADPELGRQLRPKSLRALYGVDKVKNAVHCTDLEEDGPLEVQFFFRIMAKP
jgi:nucleoside-diphosphate kinase